MSEYVFDTSDPGVRKLIDGHIKDRLADPWKVEAFERMVRNPDRAYEYWVEQVGDAELYERAIRMSLGVDTLQ